MMSLIVATSPRRMRSLISGDATTLQDWLAAYPQPPDGATLVNFTASHDGIGLRPAEGLLSPSQCARLADECRRRGGFVSSRRTPTGDAPYELNITFASALADPDEADATLSTRRFVLSQALMLALARLEYGRPYFVPPGVPDDRVQALRRAFDATMKDPDFLADAKKLSMEIDPLTGEQVQEVIARVMKTPEPIAARVRKALEPPK